MEYYRRLEVPNLEIETLKRAPTRSKPDLPARLTGSGLQWMSPPDHLENYAPPQSYQLMFEGKYHPLEFINGRWFFINWDDSDEFHGYWTGNNYLIEKGHYGLGWDEEEAPTPRPGPSFSEARGRAESGSTQPAEEPRDVSEDEDPVDRDPELTAALAASLDQPIFKDIAEAIDPPQDRTHYLPTSVPPPIYIRPTPLNPILARSTRTGGAAPSDPIGTTHPDASQIITNALKVDGQLKGRVPDVFDGDRSKAQTFMNAFNLFWMTNDESNVMKTAFKRCTYFLGLLIGPKVEDWVNDQAEILREKVTRQSDKIAKNDEVLWEDLKTSFISAFSHTGRIEEAKHDLARLEMVGLDIDDYIAKFENLLRKAEIPRTEQGSLEKFRHGLRKGIHGAILRRDVWPETIDDWQTQARQEVRRVNITRESMRHYGAENVFGPRTTKWSDAIKKPFSHQKKKDGPVPMEIDAGQVDSNKARQDDRLRKEGRCFFCHQTGHVRRNCPKEGRSVKGNPSRTTGKPKPSGRAAHIEPEAEPPSSSSSEIARAISTLDIDDRERLMEEMLNGSGF